MTTDPRLERYLSTLEKALMPFPASDRAEIITEIKSHVLAALDRDPETRLDTILASLGEPETVANRYLLERGMKPTKTSISPIVKWLVIGFLGTFAMTLLFGGFLISHFGSLIKIDGDKDRVQMLGGLIDIDSGKNRVSIGDDSGSAFAGETKTTLGDSIHIKFANGKFEITNSGEQKLAWACSGEGAPLKTVSIQNQTAELDFSANHSIKCKIAVPPGAHLRLNGDNGKIDFNSPHFEIDASLENGKVLFSSASDAHYKFDLSAQNGKIDNFKSSTEADAHLIKIHLNNGKILNED